MSDDTVKLRLATLRKDAEKKRENERRKAEGWRLGENERKRGRTDGEHKLLFLGRVNG